MNKVEVSNIMDDVYHNHNWGRIPELAKALGMYWCEDCECTYPDATDGRPYKYEPEIWLCDSCHDSRMEDEE